MPPQLPGTGATSTPAPATFSREEWEEIVRQAAQREGLDPDIALSIAQVESSFNPAALGQEVLVNGQPQRARGLMQLMPATAARHKVNIDSPFENVLGGIRELKQLREVAQGDPKRMARLYNASPQAAPEVTDPYVVKFMAEFRRRKGLPPGAPGEDTDGRILTLGGTTPPPAPPGSPFEAMNQRVLGTLKDYGIGALKGAGQTATNLGSLVHQIPGVTRAVDALYGQPGLSHEAFQQAHETLAPTNTDQSIGKTGEQIAELIIPSRALTAASAKAASLFGGGALRQLAPRMAVEAAGGAGMAAAQGGDPKTGAAFGAAVPIVGAVTSGTGSTLLRQAQKQVSQALGPTAQRYKAIAERLTPQIFARGLRGSREELVERASDMLDQVSDSLDDALMQYGPQRLSVYPILTALEDAKEAFRTVVQGATGPRMVEFEPRTLRQLEKLQDVLVGLGPNPSVEHLVALRRAWDQIVAQAGGFAHRAQGAIGLPLIEQSEAWAKREATGAIRSLLNTTFPDLAAINREWAFWKDLKDVLTQTIRRTEPQGPGLGRVIASGTARIAGATGGASAGGGVTGALGGAWLVGQTYKLVDSIITSPRWRLASAQVKNRLASALLNQDTRAIERIAAQLLGRQVGTPPPPLLPPTAAEYTAPAEEP